VHDERQRLDRPDSIIEWVAQQGVDRAKFTETYNSFGIQSKVKAFSKLSEAYKLEGVPAVGVQGRYLTAPSMMGPSVPEDQAFVRTLELVNQLVQQVRKAA
jgi:thiol:disulfide interchange protein DsbA